MLRWSGYWAANLLCLSCLWACSDVTNPDALLLTLTPSEVSTQVQTTVVLKGENFYATTFVDIDKEHGVSLNDEFEITIEHSEELPLEERKLDAQTIEFSVPAGLALGVHSIFLALPGGQSRKLEDALLVVPCLGNCPDVEVCGDGACMGMETPASCPMDCADKCAGGQWTAFSTPTRMDDVSSSSLDNAPTLSADELTMVILSLRS